MKAITKTFYEKVITEINDIKNNQLSTVAEEISIARSHGDLRENAQYASAKEKQRVIEARLNELEEILATHSIFESEGKKFNKVEFGATITIEFLDDGSSKTFRILSDHEADINNGIIAINAPIAKAIIGLKEQDEASVMLGGREREILIKNIK